MNILDRLANLGKAEQICYGVGALCLLIGILMGINGTRQVLDANASTGWEHTQGTVTKSEIERSERESKDSNGNSQTYTTYSAIVRYEYRVANKSYASQQVSFSNPNASETTAEARVSKYPVGSTVNVYYAPDDPRKAVLEPGITAESFVVAFLSLMFIVGGVICAVVGFKFGPYLRRGSGTYHPGELEKDDAVRPVRGQTRRSARAS